MIWSWSRFFVALAIAIVVGILLVGLIGPILLDIKVPIAATVGRFFVEWGFVLGLAAGVLYYFGPSFPGRAQP